MKGNGPSFPFILAFWVFISFHFLSKMKGNEGPQGQMKGNAASKGQNERMKAEKAKMKGNEGPQGQMKGNESQKGKKMQNAPGLAADKICLNLIRKRIVFGNFWGGPHIKNLTAPGPEKILAFWAFIFFHFGLFGLHFFAFWLFGLSFFHFGLLNIQYLRERRRQNRRRADQGPNLWATKPGENYMLTAAASKNRQRADRSPSPWPIKPGENSAKPPTGRPRSKPMGHQTWRKSHAYGSSVEKTANPSPNPWATKPGENCTLTAAMATRPPTGRPMPILDLAVDLLSMKTVRCSARQCTAGRSQVVEGLTPKLNPKPVKVKMKVERQRG